LEGISTEIIDEIDNNNPLVIHGENYNLQQTSLNPLEISDSYGVDIAKNETLNGQFVNTHFEAIHRSDYDFDREFSIEFIYRKARPNTISDLYPTSSITSPLIKKGINQDE
jgi:hypothetical protein